MCYREHQFLFILTVESAAAEQERQQKKKTWKALQSDETNTF